MTETLAPSSPLPQIEYTRASMKDVVQAVAHLLAHFSDKDHPGLREKQNIKRIIPQTGVIVRGRLRGLDNLVGFQLFPADSIENNVLALVFDMEAYEKHGDRYLFNMLKKVAELIREKSRPSDKRLQELSTQFMLNN